jgi:serine protease AprX
MKKFLVMTCFVASSSFAGEIHSFVKKQMTAGTTAPVIVLFKSQADFSGMNLTQLPRVQRVGSVYQALVKHANETQKSVIALLKSKKYSHRRFFITNAILINKATPSIVDAISKLPEVDKIIGNPAVQFSRPKYVENSEAGKTPVGENISSIGVERVWKELGITGQNIVIAGQDTGYQWDHPALKNHYRGWDGKTESHNYNWHDSIHEPVAEKSNKTNKCGYNLPAPCDDDRHGTHTMGTMVGSEGAKNQIGVAPGAKWIGCRNMDSGVGTPASYLECFQFFLAPTTVNGNPFTGGKPELAPHVINNSWGCDEDEGCTGDEILPALRAMKAAGIVVVASAGNDGPSCGTINDPPAYHTSFVLSVGAMNHRTREIASFSSRGPSTFDGGIGPDVTAPGVNIRSSVPGGKYDEMNWSGTSMAGPHVVGQVALMLSAQPNLIGNVDEVLSLIRSTSENTSAKESCGGVAGGKIPNNSYGYGKIRVFESVKAAMAQ